MRALPIRFATISFFMAAALFGTTLIDVQTAKAQVTQEQAKKTKFSKKKILVGKIEVNVELADSQEKQMQGLMYRQSLAKNSGMLFVFPDERERSFWMKNTIIDLSIAYISADQTIVDIQEMQATSLMEVDPPSYPSKAPAKYALEMPKNWFSTNKVKVGDKIKIK